MKKPLLFTPQGFKKIEEELVELMIKRKGAVKELTIARDMGDRSENAAYKSARQKLSSIDRRVLHLKLSIRNAKIIEKTNRGVVEIGSTVQLKNNKEIQTYSIVGTLESDVSQGFISCMSPLGRNLIGKKKGEEVIFVTPSGIKKYTVVSIS